MNLLAQYTDEELQQFLAMNGTPTSTPMQGQGQGQGQGNFASLMQNAIGKIPASIGGKPTELEEDDDEEETPQNQPSQPQALAQGQAQTAQQSGYSPKTIALIQAMSNPNLNPVYKQLGIAHLQKELSREAQSPIEAQKQQLALRIQQAQLSKLENEGKEEHEVTQKAVARRALAKQLGLQEGTPEYTDYILNGTFQRGGGKGAGIEQEAAQRANLLTQQGIDPKSPQGQSFILTGKMPDKAQVLADGDKSRIMEAQDANIGLNQSISNFDRALELSTKIGSGKPNLMLANLKNTIGLNDQHSRDVAEYNKIVDLNLAQNLKTMFGSNPTEGERAFMQKINGAADMPMEVRHKILEEGRGLAQNRIRLNNDRVKGIKDGSYWRDGGNEETKPPPSSGGLSVGAVHSGYRFKGGNPNDKSNWEAVQ